MLYSSSQLQFNLLYTFVDHLPSTLVILGLCYLMVVFHAWRWYKLNAAQNIALPFSQTIIPTYMALAFNNVLPGSIGGDFFRLYFVLKKFPTQKSQTILSIFVDRITGLLAILMILCFVAFFYLEAVRHNTVLFYLLLISFSFCAICLLAGFAIAILLSEKMRFSLRLENALRRVKFSHYLLPLLQAIHTYRHNKFAVLLSLVMAIATQCLLLIVVIIIVKVMGLPALPWDVYMLALVISQIANLVPLTPGGLGVGEAAFANVIYLLHPTTAAYATVFFALRLLSTIAYLPGVFMGMFGFNSFCCFKIPISLQSSEHKSPN